MQKPGKQGWRVTRGSYNMKNIDQSGGLDNNYHCIARGKLKNTEWNWVPDKVETEPDWEQNKTGEMETKK